MEYLLSSRKFENAKQFHSIYYSGDFHVINDKLHLLEHQSVFDQKKFDAGLNFSGAYNAITYSPAKGSISIKNDEMGMLSIFYAVINNTVFISNNIWLIIEQLSDNEIKINNAAIAAYLQHFRISNDTETFIDNLCILPSACHLTLYLDNLNIKLDRYWQLEHDYSKIPSPDQAVDSLYEDLSELFSFIKEKHPSKTIGFGNSGGLDSRLIPHFCNKYEIDYSGYIIGKTYPRYFIKSSSHESAHKIAKLYNFEHKDVFYKPQDNGDRLNLDIKNNPLGPCQIFKNPYDQLPEFDILICGGNGFSVSNDSNKWRDFEQSSNKSVFLQQYISKKGHKQFSDKIANRLGFQTYPNQKFFSNFSKHNEKIQSDFEEFVNKNKYKDNLSLIRSFHQSILNRTSPVGGFESMSRTKDFAYLYIPFAFEKTLNWPLEYFLDRSILNKLIIDKMPQASQIANQNGEKISSPQKDKIAQFASKLRGNGLDYRNWYNHNNQLHSFIKETLSRKNPLFDDLTDKNISYKDVISLHPNIALDTLKLKRFLDIIYYKEYTQLRKPEFTIA